MRFLFVLFYKIKLSYLAKSNSEPIEIDSIADLCINLVMSKSTFY